MHYLLDIFKKRISKKIYFVNIWLDEGNHFWSHEFTAFQMDIASQLKGGFKHDYFVEYHGKNFVDGHFGRLSQWLKKIESYQSIPDVFKLKDLFEKEEKTRIINHDFSDPSSSFNGRNYFAIYIHRKDHKENCTI